ncbi:MAG: tripartite tricarboxylate transporter substrate binding protein [Burkholderiales bacterium]
MLNDVSTVALAVVVAVLAPTTIAQTYPAKPIRIIVMYGPGSTIDIMARLIAPKLNEALGQPVIVENRPGAGGAIGMDMAAKAPPDGHTLTIGATGPSVTNPLLYPKTPFDPIRDFAYISLIATGPAVIAVHPSIPAKHVKDLVALAKARPGQLNYGSPGVGTSPHLAGELFKLVTATRIVHVPYKGNAEAITDLLGGQISIVFTGVPPVIPLMQAGKLKLLATTGDKRITTIPDLPTISESGYPGAAMGIWYGLVAPAATPKDILARLHKEIIRIQTLPDIRERFVQLGTESTTSTPDQFTALVRDELAKWGKVIRAAGVKIE